MWAVPPIMHPPPPIERSTYTTHWHRSSSTQTNPIQSNGMCRRTTDPTRPLLYRAITSPTFTRRPHHHAHHRVAARRTVELQARSNQAVGVKKQKREVSSPCKYQDGQRLSWELMCNTNSRHVHIKFGVKRAFESTIVPQLSHKLIRSFR